LSSLCAPGNTSRSVTHPKIAPGQARLTPEFFAGGLPEKKLQLSGISMLLILLSRGGCYKQSARRFNLIIHDWVKEEVEQLLDAGFIRPCQYTGKIQICIYFHNLNKATPKDEYPMPIANIVINNASGH
jgi:hypothetical protein